MTESIAPPNAELTTPPILHIPWIDDITGRPICDSASAAFAFIATSIIPPEAPKANKAQAKETGVPAIASPIAESRNAARP
jgi:hypothetical protein